MDTPLENSFTNEPHENAQDPHAQDDKAKHHDERSTFDYFLQETHKMIHEGRTKKAFNQLDKFLQENLTMSVIQKLKIIRRLIACACKIITKYLAKNDVSHVDIFGKLIDKSFTYLQQWHDLLSLYIVKTNPKFAHLQGLLDDLGDDSDEDLEILNRSKRDSKRDMSQSQSGGQSGSHKTSLFVNMVKAQSNNQSHKDKDHELLENTFNFLDGSRIINEEFSGKEINVNFFLDEFYHYLILTTLNWGLFLKKMQKWHAAYKYLFVTYKFTQEIESSLVTRNPDLLFVLVRARFPLAVFYLEFGKTKEALEIYEGLINVIQVAISIRLNRQKEKDKELKMIARLKKMVRLLVIIFLSLAMIYEQQENYQKVIECLKMAYWFSNKFLQPDEELYKIVDKRYRHPLIEEYRKYLHELGEIDRLILGNKKDLLDFDRGNKTPDANDHFAKVNEYLYNKFNYETLNKSQFIMIKNSRAQSASNFFKTKSDFLLDKTDRYYIDADYEKASDGSYYKNTMSPFKGDMYESSYKNSPDVEAMGNNRQSNVRPVTSTAQKKKNKKHRKFAGEAHIDLIESKYIAKPDPEEAIKEYELSEDEEREYIYQLNRNIRDEFKKKGKKEFVDIDSYFTSTIKDKIFNAPQLSRAHSQPIDFHRILKGYGYFLKEQDYDQKELGFAKKYVTAKKKENIAGEMSIKTKYVPREPKLAENNAFKIEVSVNFLKNLESKLESETILKIRNENYKNFAKSWKKEQNNRESKPLMNIQQDFDYRSSKLGFIKSSGGLGLKEGVALSNFNDKDVKSIKFALSPINHTEKQTGTEPSEREMHKSKKSFAEYSETVNNRLQLMREQIEKSIEEDDVIKRKLKNNQPLFVEKKKKERFLKVSSELGQSCLEFASKKDPEQKMLNIADMLKKNIDHAKKDKFGGLVRKKLGQIKEMSKKAIPEES